jgi:hypothetical protein
VINTFDVARKIMKATSQFLSQVQFTYLRSPNSLRVQLKEGCLFNDEWLVGAGEELKEQMKFYPVKYGAPDVPKEKETKEKRAPKMTAEQRFVVTKELQERTIFATRRDGQMIPYEFHEPIAKHFNGDVVLSPKQDEMTVMMVLSSTEEVRRLHQKVVALSERLVLVFSGHKEALPYVPPERHDESA